MNYAIFLASSCIVACSTVNSMYEGAKQVSKFVKTTNYYGRMIHISFILVGNMGIGLAKGLVLSTILTVPLLGYENVLLLFK